MNQIAKFSLFAGTALTIATVSTLRPSSKPGTASEKHPRAILTQNQSPAYSQKTISAIAASTSEPKAAVTLPKTEAEALRSSTAALLQSIPLMNRHRVSEQWTNALLITGAEEAAIVTAYDKLGQEIRALTKSGFSVMERPSDDEVWVQFSELTPKLSTIRENFTDSLENALGKERAATITEIADDALLGGQGEQWSGRQLRLRRYVRTTFKDQDIERQQDYFEIETAVTHTVDSDTWTAEESDSWGRQPGENARWLFEEVGLFPWPDESEQDS